MRDPDGVDMRTIYEYPFAITDIQKLELPSGACVSCVGMQGEMLCVWAITDTTEKVMVRHTVYVIGTGNPLPDAAKPHTYMGTVPQAGGSLVWHVFIKPD